MSGVDFPAFEKMKQDLGSCRGLIISVYSVLTWEHKYCCAVVFTLVSTIFLGIWLLEISMLTMLALAGLIGLVFDFAYPAISRLFFNDEHWSGVQETSFEQACEQLCTMKITLGNWYEFVFKAKERKSTRFVIFTSILLLALAWIGALIDNFLLMYILTMSVVMYPGIKRHGVFDGLKSKFGWRQLLKKSKKA